MIEKEIKELLTEEKYKQLKDMFEWDEVFTQTNHYYTDSNSILKEHKITVRIRETEKGKFLQIKIPQVFKDALHVSKEIEQEMTEISDILPSDLIEHLTGLKTGNLTKLGSLTTKRHIFRKDSSELCLDKNFYFDIVDYEIEMEFEEEPSKFIMKKCNSIQVTFEKEAIGKFSRFMREKNK